jgi:hypothetical protein
MPACIFRAEKDLPIMLDAPFLQVTRKRGPMRTGRFEDSFMACWVVPTVAAELWGVTVQQVLDAILSGSISSRHDNDFTFVDVAPGSPSVRKPKPFRNDPPTFTAVTDEEMLALMADDPAPATATLPAPEEIAPNMNDEMQALIEMGDWRRGRRMTSTLRKPPRPSAA